MEGLGSISGMGKIYLVLTASRLTLGPIFLGVKRKKREAEHSPSTGDEIKITWVYTRVGYVPKVEWNPRVGDCGTMGPAFWFPLLAPFSSNTPSSIVTNTILLSRLKA